MQVQSLGWEDHLEDSMATYSSILAWRISWTEESGRLQSISSVQFSCSVMSYSLRPHESQHAKPPCPLPTPRVHSHSHPSSQWCHPAISSWVIPFFSCPQSLPASESFPMSQLFAWGGQSIRPPALVAQTVKHLPAMQETRVRFLGPEDPLEKEKAIYSSILAWRIPWTEKPDRLQSTGSQELDVT